MERKVRRGALPNLENLSLPELREIEDALPGVIAKKEHTERAEFLSEMEAKAEARGLDLSSLVTPKKGSRKYGSVAPKYRHPTDKSLTWTGRGRTPLWVLAYEKEKGKSREDLLILTFSPAC